MTTAMSEQWRMKIYEIHRDGDDTFIRFCNQGGSMLYRWQRGPVTASVEVGVVQTLATFISLCGHFEDPFAFNIWLQKKVKKGAK